jgi:rod shape-determining protein MreC
LILLASSRRTFGLFLLLSFLHVLLISAQVQSQSGLPLVQSAFFGVFASVQHVTAGAGDFVRSRWSNYVALSGVAARNDALEKRVLELEGVVQVQAAAVSRTQELEDLLRLQRSLVAPTVAARVIAGDPAPGAAMITIDRGTSHGVEPDMAVIGQQGVIGRVFGRPTATAAQVQLLIGRQAAAAAVTETSRAAGVVQGGAGGPALEMNFVDLLREVQVGERVLTSGLDGIFPKGLTIGTVERAVRGSGVYSDLRIQPAVDFSRIDLVLVVLARPVRAPAAGNPLQ